MGIILGLVFIILIGIIMGLLSSVFSEQRFETGELPYYKTEIMTDAEKSFYKVLKQVLKEEYEVFIQVRLSSVLAVGKSNNRQGFLNRISSKSVDFVLCEKEVFKILLVIELDDSTHEQEKRIVRDNFVDKALLKAGIKILHVRAQKTYNLQELKRFIYEKLGVSK